MSIDLLEKGFQERISEQIYDALKAANTARADEVERILDEADTLMVTQGVKEETASTLMQLFYRLGDL